MSATNRGLARVPLDSYPTPKWCVRRLLEAVELPGRTFIDPCAGEGAIIDAIQKSSKWYRNRVWHAVEIRPECKEVLRSLAGVVHIGDFRTLYGDHGRDHTDSPVYDVAITNPPYSLAQEVIEVCLRLAKVTVMLLRVNFLGSQKRAMWLQRNTPSIYVLPNRPSFAINKHGKPGTDATEYAWFVWDRGGVSGWMPPKIKILDLTSEEELEEDREGLRQWILARKQKATPRLGRVTR